MMARYAKQKENGLKAGGFFSVPDIRNLPRGSFFWAGLILLLAALILLFSSS